MFLLVPLGVGEFLYIPAFILIIAALVQFVEMYLRKYSPVLYRAMGIYLPLITTNCAVLAAATEVAKPGFFKMAMTYNYTIRRSARVHARRVGRLRLRAHRVHRTSGASRHRARASRAQGQPHVVHHGRAAVACVRWARRLVRAVGGCRCSLQFSKR